ncbi:hypothetical protein LTR56_002997 [Elasticomyces elasticus]|nr:hypothetical protein LTR56_002997 [Elasticomyces elasticus]KAK3662060.1 hypothetical protein LTR22_007032 [Elasticomyces elasticus]KAK4927578.1 hypothetical protein LTR49_005719 [Elasticomyces elasticus]KAK5753209.1 hypothetical protein LTS12_016676 [Elasticomyces elasticus]
MVTPECEVGVLGSGIVGLVSALCLSRAGYRVTIVARDLPGDKTTEWASPWAGAIILPVEADDARDVRMQKTSFNEYGTLADLGPETGVQRARASEYWDNKQQLGKPWYANFLKGFRTLETQELPPGTICGNTFMALAVDPDVTLEWLMNLLQTKHQVRFVRQEVRSLAEAQQITSCRVLVNASGNGAGILADDKLVIPIRGQTMLVSVAHHAAAKAAGSEIKIRRGKEYTYVIPRLANPHTAIVGGIEQPGDLSTTVDTSLREDILRRVKEMAQGGLDSVDLKNDVVRDVVGFRPGRDTGYRLEREGSVVHAYGFAGTGYRYSFGAAEEVVGLVGEVMARPRL